MLKEDAWNSLGACVSDAHLIREIIIQGEFWRDYLIKTFLMLASMFGEEIDFSYLFLAEKK